MDRDLQTEFKRVQDLDSLVDFLRSELDWPIGSADLEDATFDWEPEELGIPRERIPSFRQLRELRPLVAGQPWGVFFIEFDGPRLPIGPLRRLLRSLVTKKRAVSDDSRRTWDLADLLFIVTTQSDQAVELHFVAFRDTGEATVEIRSLAWRPGRSPERHVRRLAGELLPQLAWPSDTGDTERWREQWQAAFKLRHGGPIASASRLAERMADTAGDLRSMIQARLEDERGSGPFTGLMKDVQSELVADIDEASFSDMCAQTLVYGVLSSRVTDPEGFGASPSLATVPLSNPFLSAFFEQVHDHVVDIEQVGGGLEDLIGDLRETNVEAILDQFGSTIKGGDPVIHFYEEFLTKYDREMRADAGAFYTPQPIVSFMARGVDDLLKTRFKLPLGSADVSPWSQVAANVGFSIPEGVDPNSPFLSMIDPATGTGTFLVEWLKRARDSFRAGSPGGDWPSYLREHLLSTIHAFELMLGPYAIAHLKVALELHDEGLSETEVAILLTDTLDHAPAQQTLETMRDPLAIEGEIARHLKDDERFTVVIGNPPYDREQRESSSGDARKRKGGIVRHGLPGVRPLLEDVIEPMRTAKLGKHVKNLYNDYVYFWRWATWQATQRPEGPGIVAFITAASYLDGVSMGGLRHLLRDRFDELWVVDLGGEGRGARTEENVFDIRTPVAIAFGIRSGVGDANCVVRYCRIEGTSKDKFDKLSNLDLDDSEFVEINGSGLDRFTPRSDADYHDWLEITDVFPWIHSGCQLKRTWPIGPSREVVEQRWAELIDTDSKDRAEAMRATSFREVTGSYTPLLRAGERLKPISKLKRGDQPESVEMYGYRSFDRQWIIIDSRIADRPRPPLWDCRSERQIYLTTLTSTKLGAGPVVTATPYVPDLDHFSGRGAKNVMPLFRDASAQEPNVTEGLCEALGGLMALTVTHEDLVAYVYGLAGTAAFAERFQAELGEGAGPVRVPFSAAPALFNEAVELGRELLWLHSWGERFNPASEVNLPAGSARLGQPPTTYPNNFRFIEESQRLLVGDGEVDGVSKEVWEFEVSGLQVVRSWLGYRMADRKGKKSSPLDDIRPSEWTFSDELLKLLAILERTIELTPTAADLLDRIVAGELIEASELPEPGDYQRKPPRGR